MIKTNNSDELSKNTSILSKTIPNFNSCDPLTQSILIDNLLEREGKAAESWNTIYNYPAINIKTVKNLINISDFSMLKCHVLNFNYYELEELSNIIVNYLKLSVSAIELDFLIGVPVELEFFKDSYYNRFFEFNLFTDFNNNNNRLYSINFWLKKLESLWIVEKEEDLRKKRVVTSYISNYNSKIFTTRKNEQLVKLDKKIMVNKNTGETFSMKDLALKSESNQLNELFFKNYVVQQKAIENDFEFLFITLTLPSVYHVKRKLTKTVKEGHIDLNDMYAQFRKNLNHKGLKSGVHYFYLSVNEAHKDGCEHRHIMFFCKRENFSLIKGLMNTCYLNKFYSSELKEKKKRIQKAHISTAQKNERILKSQSKITNVAIDYVEEDKEKGGSASYIYKYIMKGVDEDNGYDERYNDVKKWARINNIRQYNVSGLNLNFQSFKKCMKVFCSDNLVDNIEYLKEINVNDELDNQVIEKLTLILSPKKDKDSDDKSFNYDKLMKFNELTISNVYKDDVNRYFEKVKKIDCTIVDGLKIQSKNFYEMMDTTEKMPLIEIIEENVIGHLNELHNDHNVVSENSPLDAPDYMSKSVNALNDYINNINN
jgi:hypothetical protein